MAVGRAACVLREDGESLAYALAVEVGFEKALGYCAFNVDDGEGAVQRDQGRAVGGGEEFTLEFL